jgi:hypothetical protein
LSRCDIVSSDTCIEFNTNIGQSSVQTHTREERNGGIIHVNEPLTFTLEDTLMRQSEGAENSIQARLRGGSLPTTVEKFDPSFTQTGDQIAMQKYISHVSTCDDFSVSKFEIFACLDSSNHLTFDLTHGSFAVDLLSMAPLGGIWGDQWTVQRSVSISSRASVSMVGSIQRAPSGVI